MGPGGVALGPGGVPKPSIAPAARLRSGSGATVDSSDPPPSSTTSGFISGPESMSYSVGGGGGGGSAPPISVTVEPASDDDDDDENGGAAAAQLAARVSDLEAQLAQAKAARMALIGERDEWRNKFLDTMGRAEADEHEIERLRQKVRASVCLHRRDRGLFVCSSYKNIAIRARHFLSSHPRVIRSPSPPPPTPVCVPQVRDLAEDLDEERQAMERAEQESIAQQAEHVEQIGQLQADVAELTQYLSLAQKNSTSAASVKGTPEAQVRRPSLVALCRPLSPFVDLCRDAWRAKRGRGVVQPGQCCSFIFLLFCGSGGGCRDQWGR